ncbi:hypothetical protein [Streptomyces olivochromogenes]|uniref:Bifunctional protein FolD n=1 Tax=Streptomyces olivochromogenes TaxID=1963 RepID=A0A250VLN5_STROL|nr:hypothetical protein [Streptomyces olivochromogenes]KUN44035.1 hypothetical protein AQJ27_28465 [Streptomyces olivochromogenes]GAX54989.1 bifunctional protein FolD [Streptomyces olivochromogenes]
MEGVTIEGAHAVVVATGVPGLVGPEHIEPGATVIDVGIHRTGPGLTATSARARWTASPADSLPYRAAQDR